MLFPQTGDTQSIRISSNEEWSITNKYDTTFWTITPTQGKAGVTEVFVSASKSKDQKKAVITFQAGKEQTKLYMAVDAPSSAKSEVITITPSTYTFPASGGTLNVTVVCPDYSWSTDSNRTWVTLSPAYKTGSTTNLTVVANENTGDTRSTGFLFTVDDPDETFGYLTLSQDAASASSFGVYPTNADFIAMGGTVPVSVTGVTTSWSAFTVGDGLSISPSAGTADATVIITADANTGSTVRNGYVNFTHGTDYVTVFTTQPGGAPASYFAISPGGGTFEQTGDTKTVDVISNYPWTASTSAGYVTISPTTGTGNGSVSISVPANAGSSRNFTVVFRNSQGSSVTYGGSQGQPIKVTPSTARYAYTGESKTISVECDYTWTAISSANWFSFAPNSGSGDGTITVQTQENSGALRYADITFTDDKGNNATYQVVQEAYEAQEITITGLTDVSWSSQTQYWRASSNRTGNFTVTSSQNWCEITGLTQTGNGCTFYLSYGRNTGSNPRTTIITVAQGTGSTTATFTQAAASNYISVSPANSYCGSASTALYLSVTRSEDISAADVSYSTSGDLPYDSITWNGDKTQMVVSIPTNLTNVSRSLYITISGGTATTNASITQSPGTSIQVDVTGNTTAAYNATSASFTGSSTVQGTFTITSSNPSWCQVTGITQSGYGCTFQLTFGTNQGVSNRTSVINVTQNGVTHSFTFTQQAYQGDHYLSFGTPASRYASWQGGTSVSPVLTYNGILENTITMTEGFSGAMPVTSCTFNGSQIFIGFGQSTSFQEQSYTRTVRAQGTDGNYYSASFTWIQYPMNYNPGPVVGSVTNPIWKETVLTGVEGVNGYKLLVDNQVVYSGKIYTIPGRDIDFRINDIARDFLENEMTFTQGVSYPGGYSKTFRVAIDGGNSYNYTFYNDWSYVDNPSIYIGDPISPEIPAGALIPFSVYDGTGTITANGTSVASFGGAGQARYLLAAQTGVEYACGNIRYKGVSPCRHEYVIYYINAFGGMDAFTPQNSKMRTDNITSYDMTQRYNDAVSDFTQKRYLAEVQPTWQFNTGWLTDAQSVKMHHLIESPLVYLYDCAAGTYTPVVMTENSLQYKTWFNQGKKKISYSFTLKQSQTKQRR